MAPSSQELEPPANPGRFSFVGLFRFTAARLGRGKAAQFSRSAVDDAERE